MLLQITAIYAAIIVVGVVILANIVSAHRGRTGVSIYDGGDLRLALAIRRHGNLAENAALALLVLALSEMRGMPGWGVHALGILLIVSRVAHTVGLHPEKPTAPLRIAGGAGTQLMLLIAAGFLLFSQF